MGKQTTIQKRRIQANDDCGREYTACACPPHDGSRAVAKPDSNRQVQCHNSAKQSSAAHCASLHSFLISASRTSSTALSRHDKMTLQRNVCVCAHPFRHASAAYFELARAFLSDCSEFPRRPPPIQTLVARIVIHIRPAPVPQLHFQICADDVDVSICLVLWRKLPHAEHTEKHAY